MVVSNGINASEGKHCDCHFSLGKPKLSYENLFATPPQQPEDKMVQLGEATFGN